MQDFIKIEDQYLAKTYNRFPIMLVKGRGTKAWDSNGNKYTDFLAGIAVNLLGHCPPKIVKKLSEQAKKLIHCSNFYYIDSQLNYAKKLSKYLPDGVNKTFFCNSGTEAIEGAIKLARKATKKTDIIYMQNSFHGRTLGSLSATDKPKYQDPFKPLVPGFIKAKYDNIDSVKSKINQNTAAIIIEPIQGEGGINIPKKSFIKDLRKLCTDHGILLIFDEVQTGFGRTGHFFALEYFDVVPDIITMGKAIAAGFPMGAFSAKDEIMDIFNFGDHAATFGGNPLVCSVALESINLLEENNLVEKAKEMGKYFLDKLNKYKSNDLVKDVRGLGLMIAIELYDSNKVKEIVNEGLNNGFLLNQTSNTVLRFVPPLIISKEEIDDLVSFLDSISLN